MQSEAIQALTARYDLREDRVALDCKIHTGDVETLYFTQRLSCAIVAALVEKIQSDPGRSMINDFLQDEAVSQKPPSDAVEIGNGVQSSWLVTHMHLQDIVSGTRVIFAHDEERGAHLECDEALLRNIIDIFHKAFGLADWPRNVFPSWVSPAKLSTSTHLLTN